MLKKAFLASALLMGLITGTGAGNHGTIPVAQATIRGGGGPGGGGGCDGHGAAARCKTCGAEDCENVCVGGSHCTEYADQDGPTCISGGFCASGGPFGGGGGGVIMQ